MKMILIAVSVLAVGTAVSFLSGWLIGRANPTLEEPMPRRMRDKGTTAAPMERFVSTGSVEVKST